VDEALKYETGAVADLLKSVKRNFGTEAYSQEGGQDQGILPGYGGAGSVSLAGYEADGGAFIPRLPTTEELSRWPKQMAREFFRMLDGLLQNNPLLIDPNKLESHHGLPQAFIKYFLDCGLKIEEFIMIMRVADHRLKPDGWHTGKGRGGDWLTEWEEFMKIHPRENSEERQTQIRDKLEEMLRKRGVDPETVLPARKPRRK